ncbi:hypothetical protein AOQ73_25545 [Bradyrhizobium pachyrhizi]|nr:hypothetical protein AOQ73_25545 [Bradyrhizobium pachyrhizi]OMH98538.1 hypothetical protein BSN85_39195 [Bradyrhizobium brasilense]
MFNAHRPFQAYPKPFLFRVSVANCLEGAKFDLRKIPALLIFESQSHDTGLHQGPEFALHTVELASRRHKAPASTNIFIGMTQYLYRFQSGILDPVGLP